MIMTKRKRKRDRERRRKKEWNETIQFAFHLFLREFLLSVFPVLHCEICCGAIGGEAPRGVEKVNDGIEEKERKRERAGKRYSNPKFPFRKTN